MIDRFITAVNNEILNPVIILLFAIALIVFLWGLVQFIQNAADAGALETAKRHVLYGLIGMFIMMSAFAIIRITLNTFGINTSPVDQLQK